MPVPTSLHTMQHQHKNSSLPIGRSLNWPQIRRYMLVDNSYWNNTDQSACLDMLVRLEESHDVQRCIRTLYQGLKWAEIFKIRGGYTGNRRYNKVFFLEDQNILGIFDNRHYVSNLNKQPETVEELIQYYQENRNDIKTLIVFEKPNLRLANSDERCRQSSFVSEIIYPAFLAIMRVIEHSAHYSQKEDLSRENSTCHTAHNNQLSKIYKLFSDAFKNPTKTDELLIKESPLKLFFNSSSIFNINIEYNTQKTITRMNLLSNN